jgi:hypothetical protein
MTRAIMDKDICWCGFSTILQRNGETNVKGRLQKLEDERESRLEKLKKNMGEENITKTENKKEIIIWLSYYQVLTDFTKTLFWIWIWNDSLPSLILEIFMLSVNIIGKCSHSSMAYYVHALLYNTA